MHRFLTDSLNQELLDAVAAQVAILDADGFVVAANQAWEQSRKAERRPIRPAVGEHYLRTLQSAAEAQGCGDPARFAELRDVLSGRASHCTHDYTFTDSTGARRWFQIHIAALSPSVGGAVITYIENTAIRRAEQALHHSDVRFRRIFDANVVGVMFWDTRGYVTDANEMFLRMIGYGPQDLLAGRIRWSEITPPEYRARDEEVLREMLATGKPCVVEKEYSRASGRRVPVYLAAAFVDDSREHGICLAIDLTEVHRLREELARSHRLESVGRLASGVAHDFNNLLAIISGYSEALLRAMPADNDSRSLVNQITNAVGRGTTLIRQLLTFSRGEPTVVQTIELEPIIRSTCEMLRRLISSSIQTKVDITGRLHRIDANAAQIEQILVNLALNARDAMPRGGVLAISAESVKVEGALKVIPAGEYVHLRVADTGAGMDPETRERAFDPFFTTKKGAGFGLGLSVVYGIVQERGGRIVVDSEPGSGTTVDVYLPISKQNEERRLPTQGELTPSAAAASPCDSPSPLPVAPLPNVELPDASHGWNLHPMNCQSAFGSEPDGPSRAAP